MQQISPRYWSFEGLNASKNGWLNGLESNAASLSDVRFDPHCIATYYFILTEKYQCILYVVKIRFKLPFNCLRQFIPIFKVFVSRPLFIYFFLFYKQLSVNNCSSKVAGDWIRTSVLCVRRNHAANCATTTAQTFLNCLSTWVTHIFKTQSFSQFGKKIVMLFKVSGM